MQEEKNNIAAEEDQPPIFKTWPQWYIFLLLWLALLIFLFYLFTKKFA